MQRFWGAVSHHKSSIVPTWRIFAIPPRSWKKYHDHDILSRFSYNTIEFLGPHRSCYKVFLLYLLLIISMLWHRQAIFESKGDKLSSSAEGRIRTQRVSDTYSPADWMPADKPTELSRIKLKTWTWQPVPMISKHSAHLTPLPFGIRTWLWRYTYLLLLILMLWHRQAIFESKRDKLSSFAEGRIRTQRVSDTYSPADWMPADKPTELSRIKLKTSTRQPVPMISKHSAHLTPLPFGIRTWLWRYTYLLLLISMLWHRQAILESKRDKLSSSAESRIHTYLLLLISMLWLIAKEI